MFLNETFRHITENINKKIFEKELEKVDNVYDYLNPEKWGKLKDIEKQIIIQKLVEKEAKELEIINIPTLNIYQPSIGSYDIGGYERETNNLYISNNILNNPYDVYNTIVHELTHAKQHENIKNHISDELHFICLNDNEVNIIFCNETQKQGVLHISPTSYKTELSLIFYMLSLPEREAYQRAYEKELKYNPYAYDKLQETYTDFNEYYKTNLTNEEINMIIDDSFKNLYFHQNPVDNYKNQNLKATVMYDIMCLSFLIKEDNIEYRNMLDKEYSRLILSKYEYVRIDIPPLNNLEDKVPEYVKNLKELQKLNNFEQKINPMLFIKLVLLCKEENISIYIKDKEAFLYELEKTKYDDFTKNKIKQKIFEYEKEIGDYEYE